MKRVEESTLMDEFARISYWTNEGQDKTLLESRGVKLAIGDDAAIISNVSNSEAYESLYTVDTMVEDIHFNRQTMSLEQIG
jgi:thiamine-monophosphate kinase